MNTHTPTLWRRDVVAFCSDFNDYLEGQGLEPVEVRLDYSGRGMYGKTCLAFVCDEPFRVMIRLGMFLGSIEDQLLLDDWRAPIFDAFDRHQVSSDQMGRQGTVLYWKRMEVAG